MTLAAVQHGALDERVEELRAVLEEQLAALDRREAQLAELSECILACDNERMESLLSRMEEAVALQAAADARLAAARDGLAAALLESRRLPLAGAETGERPGPGGSGAPRLAEMIAVLPSDRASALAALRGRILDRVGQVRRRHLRTTILLSESARVNRLLLDCLTPRRPAVTLYDRRRRGDWRCGDGLLDEAR
jgi:hypothetical protein